MATLRKSDTIPLLNTNQKVKILDFIAEGGQGEVYRVEYNNSECALKWYSKHTPSDAFYDNLAKNVKIGSPQENFLWPQAITEKVKGKFGYLMRLKPPSYSDYGDYLTGFARFQSWDLLFF